VVQYAHKLSELEQLELPASPTKGKWNLQKATSKTTDAGNGVGGTK